MSWSGQTLYSCHSNRRHLDREAQYELHHLNFKCYAKWIRSQIHWFPLMYSQMKMRDWQFVWCHTLLKRQTQICWWNFLMIIRPIKFFWETFHNELEKSPASSWLLILREYLDYYFNNTDQSFLSSSCFDRLLQLYVFFINIFLFMLLFILLFLLYYVSFYVVKIWLFMIIVSVQVVPILTQSKIA